MCTALSALCQTSLSPCVLHLGNALKCCKSPSHHTMSNRNHIRRLFSPVNKFPSAVEHEKRMYGAAALASSTIPGVLSKQQAKDLAVRLTSDERDVLISALQECQSKKTKAEYEGQLAAFRWRSQFGRPSSVPSLGDVDPTGSYCAVPEDWLLRKYGCLLILLYLSHGKNILGNSATTSSS